VDSVAVLADYWNIYEITVYMVKVQKRFHY